MSVYQSMTGYGQIAWSSGDSPPQYKTFTVSLHECITAKSRSEVLDKSATVPIEVGQLVLSHVYHYSQSPLFPSKFQLNFDSWYNYHKHRGKLYDRHCVWPWVCVIYVINYSFLFVSYTKLISRTTIFITYILSLCIFSTIWYQTDTDCTRSNPAIQLPVEAALHKPPLTWTWNKIIVYDVNPGLIHSSV